MSDPTTPNDKRDLLSAFDQVLEREKTRAVEAASGVPARRRTPPWVAVLGLLGWGLLAWTWLARPAWLFPPDPASLMTPAQREAQLRFGIYLQVERVRDFRTAHGRLPTSLAETGEVEEGVSYRATSDTSFVISGSVDGRSLALASTESSEVFLRGGSGQ